MPITTLPKKPAIAKTLIVSAIAVLAWAYVSNSQGQGLASPQEITKLIETQQFGRAQTRINESLKVSPNDPQLQFLAGLVAQSQGKTAEAISIYNKLTKDHPQLPEAYNNLAVIYAAQGDLDGARSMLEKAITTHPSYSTAHNNLGGVYAKLSSRAYSKALQVNANTSNTEGAKLDPIMQVTSLDASKEGLAKTSAAANNKITTVANATSPNKIAASNDTSQKVVKTIEPIASSSQAKIDAALASKQAAAKAAEEKAKLEAKQAVKSEPKTDNAKEANSNEVEVAAVKKAISSWSSAWSSQNMGGYFGSYHKSFTPPSGLSRSAWEAQRKERIVGRNSISIKIKDVNVKLDGDHASAQFHQDYASGAVKSSGKKTLQLIKSGSRWLIVRESI